MGLRGPAALRGADSTAGGELSSGNSQRQQCIRSFESIPGTKTNAAADTSAAILSGAPRVLPGNAARPRLIRSIALHARAWSCSPTHPACAASPSPADATSCGPPARGPLSGNERSNWSRCRHSGCAGSSRRIAGTAAIASMHRHVFAKGGHLLRKTPASASAFSRSIQSCSVSRVAVNRRSHSCGLELVRQLDGRELRGVKYLVRICIADSAENARIGQSAL